MSADWQIELVDSLRFRASELRSAAWRLGELARKIESPPEGVRVEYAGRDTVRFVGPSVAVSPLCGRDR